MKGRRRPTSIDETRVGLSFIEVLFALVIARALDPMANYPRIPGVGLSHLAVAFVLTVTSWIGYHNSWNRPRYFIRFANLPLWQFLVDVALVVLYWFAAVSAEGTGTDLGKSASARPEAVFVALSFLLYCAWDRIGLAIRESDLYYKSPPARDIERRRQVTRVFAAASCVAALVIWLIDPSAGWTVIAADAFLIILILLFRFAKEMKFVTPNSAYSVDRDSTKAELETTLRRALDELSSLP